MSKYYSVKYPNFQARIDKSNYAKHINEQFTDKYMVAACIVAANNEEVKVYLRFDRRVTKEQAYELGDAVFQIPNKQEIQTLSNRLMRKAYLTHLLETDKHPAGFLGEYERQIITFETHLSYFLNNSSYFDVFDPFVQLFPECYDFIKACWVNRDDRYV